MFLPPLVYCHYRERTNIEVHVEIETHPRGARQSSLSSIRSNRSLSLESLGYPQSQSHDYLCASELEERREGGGDKEEQEGREKPGGEAAGGDEGTRFPVFEVDSVWGCPMQASYLVENLVRFYGNKQIHKLICQWTDLKNCWPRPPSASKTGPPTICLLAPASKKDPGSERANEEDENV